MQNISSDKPTNLVDFRLHFLEQGDFEEQRALWEELKRKNVEKLLTIVSESE